MLNWFSQGLTRSRIDVTYFHVDQRQCPKSRRQPEWGWLNRRWAATPRETDTSHWLDVWQCLHRAIAPPAKDTTPTYDDTNSQQHQLKTTPTHDDTNSWRHQLTTTPTHDDTNSWRHQLTTTPTHDDTNSWRHLLVTTPTHTTPTHDDTNSWRHQLMTTPMVLQPPFSPLQETPLLMTKSLFMFLLSVICFLLLWFTEDINNMKIV